MFHCVAKASSLTSAGTFSKHTRSASLCGSKVMSTNIRNHLAQGRNIESDPNMEEDLRWTRDWRPARLRRGYRYHDSPPFTEMMRILSAMDPYQDRLEDRDSLLTVRNDRPWIWPSCAPNLQVG